MKSLDFIGAIELAYDRSSDEKTWLDEVTKTVAPAFGGPSKLAVSSYVFDLSDQQIQLGTTSRFGEGDRYGREDFQRAHEQGRQHGPISRAYTCEPYTLLSRAVGIEDARRSLRAAGFHADDNVGLRSNATPESGVIIMRAAKLNERLRDRELWTRFAAHLGAALRLRRSQKELSPDSAPAILTPGGRLEHGDADTIAAATSLAGAAKAIDRARGKLRRLDPEAAAALWRTMVKGEWSLVDWYDHDGKRFLLAQENRVPSRTKRMLTKREEQVVACAAMGHGNKLIAYDLGISPGSVAVLLGRAARKLGVSGRVGLVQAFRERAVP